MIYFRLLVALAAGGLVGSGLTAHHFYQITRDSSQVEAHAIWIMMYSFYALVLLIGAAIAAELAVFLIQRRKRLAHG